MTFHTYPPSLYSQSSSIFLENPHPHHHHSENPKTDFKLPSMAKPLNPMAPPYQKSHLYPFPPHHHHYHHHRIFHPPLFYNIHFQPRKSSPRLPLPPPPRRSEPKKKRNSPLTPVPSGPRNAKVWLPVCGRKVVTKAGEEPEKKANRKRWKNKRGGYKQNLEMESETTTSVMIKNIPNLYSRELLIRILDNHCKMENQKIDDHINGVSAYDYLYLPIDFTNGVNAGFAFVNFTNSKAAFKFRDAFDGKFWEGSNSRKVARIFRARIQGKEALINNCRAMDFRGGSDEALPVVFDPARDGSGRVNCQMVKLGKFLR
ncbi:hypothetical protein SSX86_017524 [Deinandra increscens subsp. villosa]|uniref:Mei2-like C-terminal RNA recognition motif domain-containing protein n=1 Tax=Deinandra increscens subsp. villosa TaxID=3103831 RepID=A0AAP0D2M1_9ASTR